MNVGLFLDVDNTLTSGFIQHQYAKLLGSKVEAEYLRIEDQYQRLTLSSDEFGQQLINLFNSTEFNDDYAASNLLQIRPARDAEAILKLPLKFPNVNIYLVSAAPSYYIDRFAKRYDISMENVLCSKYKFENQKLTSCDAVQPQDKRNFQIHHRGTHDLTIGIGDDEGHDGLFIAGCDVGILTRNMSRSYLYAENLGVARAVVENFIRR
jgi:phosphoserine phosphatase